MAKINEVMTVGEPANCHGVCRDSLRRWDRAGQLKAQRYPISEYRLYLKGKLDGRLCQLAAAEKLADRSCHSRRSTQRAQ
jgi:DNA-binding transcriptional MerR regulator